MEFDSIDAFGMLELELSEAPQVHRMSLLSLCVRDPRQLPLDVGQFGLTQSDFSPGTSSKTRENEPSLKPTPVEITFNWPNLWLGSEAKASRLLLIHRLELPLPP